MADQIYDRLPTDPGSLDAIVDAFSGGHLRGSEAPFGFPAETMRAAGGLEYFRLRGARRGEQPPVLPETLFAGLSTTEAPVAFVICSDGEEAFILVGTARGRGTALASLVHAGLGGPDPVVAAIDLEPLGAHIGCLHGIPAAGKVMAPPLADLLLDAMRGTTFTYLVLATPEPREHGRATIGRLRQLSQHVERTHVGVSQAGANRAAVRARHLLEMALRRLEPGHGGGMWRVSMLAGCGDSARLEQILATLCGGLADAPERCLTPLQGYRCGSGQGYSVHSNVLTPGELGALCILPGRDRLGFARRPETRFDVDHPTSAVAIEMGHIMDGDAPTRRAFGISPAILCHHALVAGHTGFGKSSTVRGLLRGLARRNVPFLVLEPAVPGYRQLAAEMPELSVFRVGEPPEPNQPPFLLNPLAFPDGFPLSTHIDLVKQAFVASFGMAPPAPYLLESAINRVYERRGWDLATGRHPRGHDRLAFPTLSDLLEEVDPVVDAAGYDTEVSRNMRGMLRVRIGSMCGAGPRGAALDTRDGLPDELLYDSPVVLELHRVGSDQDKAFLMGLVLMSLYEHRQVARGEAAGDLRHLLVIEEAHCLLRRTIERPADEGNMAHQAVQAFSNMIAEVRHYGQGVLIVEQVPSKLAPDAIKQTALKVIHRLGPSEDREAVGSAMVLTAEQKEALALLPIGDAVVHSEELDGAIKVRMSSPVVGQTRPIDMLARVMSRLGQAERERLEAVMRRAPLAGVLARVDIRSAADRCLLLMLGGGDAGEALGHVRTALARVAPSDSISFETVSMLAMEDALLRRALTAGLGEDFLARLAAQIKSRPQDAGAALAGMLRRPQGPWRWCDGCPSPCLYRYEGAMLAEDHVIREEIAEARRDGVDQGSWGEALAQAVHGSAARLLDMEDRLPEALVYCAGGHALQSLNLSARSIRRILDLARSRMKENDNE